MTPESKLIAIAEACGWKKCKLVTHPIHGTNLLGTDTAGKHRPIPDYLSDLNAMHEAEKMLTTDWGKQRYADALLKRTGGEYFDVLSSTAAQRAEAFIETMALSETIALSEKTETQNE